MSCWYRGVTNNKGRYYGRGGCFCLLFKEDFHIIMALKDLVA